MSFLAEYTRTENSTKLVIFRFKVSVEMIKPDKLDAGTTLKGLDYIDVPGSVKRDYKLNFFAHKEGTFGAKVTMYCMSVWPICIEKSLHNIPFTDSTCSYLNRLNKEIKNVRKNIVKMHT